MEDEELFVTAALGDGIGGRFAEGEAKVGRAEEVENLRDVHPKRRAARMFVEGKSQVDVEAARFEEAIDQLGIFAAAGGVDGAEAGVFQKIVESGIEGVREGEDVGLKDFDGGTGLGEAVHFADSSG